MIQAITAQFNAGNFSGSQCLMLECSLGAFSIWTIEFWIWFPSLPATDAFVLAKGPGTGTINLSFKSNAIVCCGSDPLVITPRRWTHFAVQNGGGSYAVYRDGQLLVRGNPCSANSIMYRHLIGCKDTNSGFVNSVIDELRVWNTTRSASDIQTFYRSSIADPLRNPALQLYVNFDNFKNGINSLIKPACGLSNYIGPNVSTVDTTTPFLGGSPLVCAPGPCGNRGRCVDGQGDNSTCICYEGFTGPLCYDLNECATRSHNCSAQATCQNSNKTVTGIPFTCTCNTGYSGDGVTCLDMDECALRLHDCAVAARCDNTLGGFRCTCPPDYVDLSNNTGRICGAPCMSDVVWAATALPGTRGGECLVTNGSLQHQQSCVYTCAPGWQAVGVTQLQCLMGNLTRQGSCVAACPAASATLCPNSTCTSTNWSFVCAPRILSLTIAAATQQDNGLLLNASTASFVLFFQQGSGYVFSRCDYGNVLFSAPCATAAVVAPSNSGYGQPDATYNATQVAELRGLIDSGAGTNCYFTLLFCALLDSTLCVQLNSSQHFHFPAPVLRDGTLRFRNGVPTLDPVTGLSHLLAPTRFPQQVEFGGDNFPINEKWMKIYFGPITYPLRFSCAWLASFSSRSNVTCSTQADAIGLDLVFTVVVGDFQQTANGRDTLSFPSDIPMVSAVRGCDQGGCPTKGNIELIIRGAYFGEKSGVLVNSIPTLTTPINSSVLVCILPPGLGVNIPLVVSSGDKLSDAFYISYAYPLVSELRVASPISLNSSTSASCRNDGPLALVDCPRQGGLAITLLGDNFGSFGASVFLGRFLIAAQHDDNFPHNILTFTLPAGFAESPLIVIQYNSLISRQPLSVSYMGCPAGYYGSDYLCVPCAPGLVAMLSGQSSCFLCLEGTITNSTASSACEDCPAGKYSSPNRTECLDCPPGFTAGRRQGRCDACPAGTFSLLAGSPSCSTCPAGAIAPSSAFSSCLNCDPGKYSVNDPLLCRLCGMGTVSSSDGASACTLCPPGKIANSAGLSNCTNCPAGMSATPDRTLCVACAAGFYRAEGNSEICLPCPLGFVSADNAKECSACLPGFFAFDMTECRLCPVGRVSNQSATACSECELGRGAQDGTICVTCPPGTVGLQGACSECAPGQYSNSNNTFCNNCPNGKFQATSRSTSCDDCAQGFAQAETGRSSCSQCAQGRVSSGVGWGECVSCPGGAQAGPNRDTCECPEDSYVMMHASTNTTTIECGSCPQGADCRRGNDTFATLRALPGWWRSDAQALFIRCLALSRCPGGAPNTCLPGRTGLACTECEAEYYEWDNKCVRCNAGASAGLFFLILLVAVCYVGITYHLSQSITALPKVFFFFVQAVVLIVPVQELNIGFLNVLDFSLFDSSGAVCLAPLDPYQKYVFIVLQPFILLALTAVIMLVHYYYLKHYSGATNLEFQTLFVPYVRCLTSLVIFISLRILRTTINFFHCVQVGPKRVVSSWPSIDCDSARYKAHLALNSLIFILFFFVGPVLAIRFFIQNNLRLESRDTNLLSRWGVLYEAYDRTIYWYEIIALVRRIVMIILVVFLWEQPHTQNYALAIFFVVLLVTHFRLRPFVTRLANTLEAVSLVVLLLSALTLAVYAPALPRGARIFISLMAITWTFCLAVFLLYQFSQKLGRVISVIAAKFTIEEIEMQDIEQRQTRTQTVALDKEQRFVERLVPIMMEILYKAQEESGGEVASLIEAYKATDGQVKDAIATSLLVILRDKRKYGPRFLPLLYKMNLDKLDGEKINRCATQACHEVLVMLSPGLAAAKQRETKLTT